MVEFPGSRSVVLVDGMFDVDVDGFFCAVISAFDVASSIVPVSKCCVEVCE